MKLILCALSRLLMVVLLLLLPLPLPAVFGCQYAASTARQQQRKIASAHFKSSFIKRTKEKKKLAECCVSSHSTYLSRFLTSIQILCVLSAISFSPTHLLAVPASTLRSLQSFLFFRQQTSPNHLPLSIFRQWWCGIIVGNKINCKVNCQHFFFFLGSVAQFVHVLGPSTVYTILNVIY